MILGPESAPLSKLYWSVMMENENDSGRRISLIILVVGIQKFAAGTAMSGYVKSGKVKFGQVESGKSTGVRSGQV